jgi:hypothetical protein
MAKSWHYPEALDMQIKGRGLCLVFAIACAAFAAQNQSQPSSTAQPTAAAASSSLAALLESNVKTEWDAFKNKNKQAYSDLLTDDFAAIEDDGQGMRTKAAATAEVDRSVVSNYYLFAFNILPLGSNAALVTYELTLQFPPKAVVRLKRVLVSELWIKTNGKWKERYYQETKVR